MFYGWLNIESKGGRAVVDISADAFRQAVREICQDGNVSLVRAVFRVDARFARLWVQKHGDPWVCHKGCGACCFQAVQTSVPEWNEIKLYIAAMGEKERYDLLRDLKRYKPTWREWYKSHQFGHKLGDFDKTRMAQESWIGKPCPFLGDDGACRIYPVRPYDCRNTFSTVQCESVNVSAGVTRYPYPWHHAALSIITEEHGKFAEKQIAQFLVAWIEEL
ncbi:MAG: YkgJ family cysteine cluster protein [bacterium]